MGIIRRAKNAVDARVDSIKRQNQELIWAQVWKDTINGLNWMQDLPSISPGRYAVGYNYLYVMTRILNDLKPKSVLEMGLGISSTLISHYFKKVRLADGQHTIIEHDQSWADFYTQNHELSPYSEIIVEPCIIKKYKNKPYNAYKDLKERMGSQKYSVISIDGPIGWGSQEYSRRDIIELLPDILEDNFVIVMDDAERIGEKRTIDDIQTVLKSHGIVSCVGEYAGLKTDCVIASESNKFMCSL